MPVATGRPPLISESKQAKELVLGYGSGGCRQYYCTTPLEYFKPHLLRACAQVDRWQSSAKCDQDDNYPPLSTAFRVQASSNLHSLKDCSLGMRLNEPGPACTLAYEGHSHNMRKALCFHSMCSANESFKIQFYNVRTRLMTIKVRPAIRFENPSPLESAPRSSRGNDGYFDICVLECHSKVLR